MSTTSTPPRRRISSSQRGWRNAAISASRDAGLTWAQVARLHGVSERTARQADADHRTLLAQLRTEPSR